MRFTVVLLLASCLLARATDNITNFVYNLGVGAGEIVSIYPSATTVPTGPSLTNWAGISTEFTGWNSNKIAMTGTNITAWTNTQGSALVAYTVSTNGPVQYYPTNAGIKYPVVHLNSGDLESTVSWAYSNITVVVVAANESTPNNARLIACANYLAGDLDWNSLNTFGIQVSAGPSFEFIRNSATLAGTLFPDTGYFIAVFRKDGADIHIDVKPLGSGSTTSSTDTSNPAAFNIVDFVIGGIRAPNSQWKGPVAHVAVFNRALDNTETAAVITYLDGAYTP